jgi:hypothetical protein
MDMTNSDQIAPKIIEDEAEKKRMSRIAELNMNTCEGSEDSPTAVRELITKEMAKPRMSKSAKQAEQIMDLSRISQQPSTTLPGRVDKIIQSRLTQPEKVQISIQGGDRRYRDLRIENTLLDQHGNDVRLKKGAHVDITIEAKKPRK